LPLPEIKTGNNVVEFFEICTAAFYNQLIQTFNKPFYSATFLRCRFFAFAKEFAITPYCYKQTCNAYNVVAETYFSVLYSASYRMSLRSLKTYNYLQAENIERNIYH